ncbi:hypothetical protein ANCDUO_09645 [Ancylostoma duodenale]|uniref:Uncharacterized protein n=1 Tax=Ancylostoma duodenale TaxID=51022 RepID=A0A0C2GMA6_9BILA|nr:hypothetical protein ANCDUO_09645 [Ancylostoma duodenale]
MSQQMLLVRAREQELLDEIDVIMNHKERTLEHQQQTLYRNIWECKQALEKVREGGSTTGAAEVLFRIGHVEVASRESAYVSFESDAIGLRSRLMSFGTIRTSSRHDDINRVLFNTREPTPGESLPMEMEEYDDDALMAHKSVLRMRSNPSSSTNMSRQQVESVRRWLKKIPSGPGALDADVSTIMAEFDVIKNSTPEAEAESSDSASSFDLVAQDSGTPAAPTTPAENILSAEFINTLQQPLSSWLMRIMPKEPQEVRIDTNVKDVVEEPLRPMKRPHSCGDIRRHYGFQDVISNIRNSSNDTWILGSEPVKKTRTEQQTAVAFNENEFVSHLSKLFLCNPAMSSSLGQSSPLDKPRPQEVDLSTILGWKQVLDKIEQSAPYWLRNEKH